MKQTTMHLRFSLPALPRPRDRLRAVLAGSVLSALFLLGLGGSLWGLMTPPGALIVPLLLGLGSCFIFTFLWETPRLRLWGFLIMAVWLAAFCLIMRTDLLNGLYLTANQVGELLGRRFGHIYPTYGLTVEEGGYPLSSTLLSVPVSVLLALLCSYMARARAVILSLVLTAALFFACVFLNAWPPALWLAALLLAQFLLLAGAPGVRAFFVGRSAPALLAVCLVAAGVFGVVTAAGALALPGAYGKSPLADARDGFTRGVDRLRYGVDPALGMPDGDFTGLAPFDPAEDTALEVTMENPVSLWMRGYVGAQYTGRGWQQDDPAEMYENADLFYWLHTDNFYGQTQLADAAVLSGADMSERAFGVEVDNLGASSRNIYAPYEVYWAGEELLSPAHIGDAALNSGGLRGNRQYTYLSLPNQVRRYPDLVRALYSEEREQKLLSEPFLIVESNYAQFVYEQYTRLPGDAAYWLEERLGDVLPQGEEVSYAEAKQAILTYLTEQTRYEPSPAAATGSDFAYEFLFSTKQGYSVHYATAATLMFRACGIPARYVEGYLITPADVQDLEGPSTLALDGTHAHAWVEVYQSGVGWIPVEVTPPYFGLMEEADSLVGVPGAGREEGEGAADDDTITQSETNATPHTAEEARPRAVWPFVLAAVLLCLALAIALLLWRIHRRRQRLRERLAACGSGENRTAVLAMFLYAMDILNALGLKAGGVWLIGRLMPGVRDVGGVPIQRFDEMFALYELAAYSSGEPDDEQRREMEAFLADLLGLLRARFTGLGRLRARYVLNLY